MFIIGSLGLALSACAPAPPPKVEPPKVTTTVPTSATTTVPSAPATPPTTVPGPPVPIMGSAVYSAAELTAWYNSKNKVPADGSCATVAALASNYISEGASENVRGDLAFIQAMIETGWLKHSERVPASWCNYAGIGAVDSGTGANVFPSSLIGVRAQIQHLRAYADRTTTCSNFTHPNESPRCHLVSPKGKSPTWNQMGNGNWATDPAYGSKVITLLANLKAFAGH